MEYKLPKDISQALNVTLKTVYNYLKRHPDKIRSKKEYWKTFVHYKDFEQVFQKVQNPFNSPLSNSYDNSDNKPLWTIIEWDSKFQKETNILKTENQQLAKRNDGLERQIKQYGEMYLSEKEEKKERIAKHDSLQINFSQTIKQHSKEKTKILKKYYMIFWMCIILVVLILAVLIYIINQFMN